MVYSVHDGRLRGSDLVVGLGGLSVGCVVIVPSS